MVVCFSRSLTADTQRFVSFFVFLPYQCDVNNCIIISSSNKLSGSNGIAVVVVVVKFPWCCTVVTFFAADLQRRI